MIVDFGIQVNVDNMGVEVRRFTWRLTPLTFASSLSVIDANTKLNGSSQWSFSQNGISTSTRSQQQYTSLLVTGSYTSVDIWSMETGKVVHIFETKQDRIKKLNFLFVKNEVRLYILAEEEKDGTNCSSIISIFQDYKMEEGDSQKGT